MLDRLDVIEKKTRKSKSNSYFQTKNSNITKITRTQTEKQEITTAKEE